MRYSTRLFRVPPQELNETVEKHASHNHDDGQNTEPHSHQALNIRDVVTLTNERPVLNVRSRYLPNKMKTKVCKPKDAAATESIRRMY